MHGKFFKRPLPSNLKARICFLPEAETPRHCISRGQKKRLADSFYLIIKTIKNLSATFGQFLTVLIQKEKKKLSGEMKMWN